MNAYVPTDELFQIRRTLAEIKAAVFAPPKLAYSMAETCKAIGISEPTLRDWMRKGRLSGTRTGGTTGAWLFPVEAVKAALDWKEADHAERL